MNVLIVYLESKTRSKNIAETVLFDILLCVILYQYYVLMSMRSNNINMLLLLIDINYTILEIEIIS